MAEVVMEAVEYMVSARGPLINKLKSSEALGKIDEVHQDISRLRAFIQDVPRLRLGLREIDLYRQIKNVIYDLEDSLECWMVGEALNNTSIFTRLRLRANEKLLAANIDSIRDDRLQPLFRRIQTYADLRSIPAQQPTHQHQVLSEQLYKEVNSIKLDNIFADETETLITNLIKETGKLDVICITGMPGIGKTTLAKNIYQNEAIMKNFPTLIWVDIPLEFDRVHLCVDIIKGFISRSNPQGSCSNDSYIEILNEFEESGSISNDKLKVAITTCLEKSRFLLVMDGVWTAETLYSIMHFFPQNGKVLITSRQNHISRDSHLLRFLNEKESWELLQLAVFGNLNDCPETLKSIGECIAKNCDGLPLAINVLANALMVPSEAAKDLTEHWWKKVSENVTNYITDYCAHHNVFKSIETSYNKLPPYLRNFFLYLGVFPEGDEISVRTLTRLWIAEGLVRDTFKLSLEDIVEEGLRELIHGNLVMVGKRYPNGQIKTCRLHKLMYGFCKYKADEQEFYHEIKISKGGALDCPTPLTSNHRRLCIHSGLSKFLSSGPKGRSVRSILCLNKGDKQVLDPKYSSSIHKPFKLLRILECKSSVEFNKFPSKLSKLINLRYITLSCDDLVIIPKSITSLCFLETLIVDTQSTSVELKANIWRMPELRHLVTKAAIVVAIQGEGEAGKNLQTLSRLAAECCTKDVLRRVPNLKTLGIRGQLAAVLSDEPLSKLWNLEQLKLINENSELHGRLHQRCFPPKLTSLTLSGTYLGWESLSVLGKIDSLEILKLKNNAFMGASWNTNADGFRGLGFLHIGTTDLVSWEASSAGCFPRLRWLVLNGCQQLQEIPSILAQTLHKLDAHDVSASARQSAGEIQQAMRGMTTEN